MLYNDLDAKAAAYAECEKRNRHKSKHIIHMTWKPLWAAGKGWHPAFRRVSGDILGM
jgi:hypothetical protein